MLHIIWALITLASFGYFLYVVIIGGKAVREKLGGFALIIFVLGLFSFNAHHKNNNVDPVTHEIKKWHFTPVDSTDGKTQITSSIAYYKTLMSTYYIDVEYATDKHTGLNVPINAYATMSGTQLGTDWTVQSMDLEPSADHTKLKYTIYVLEEWRLLGITFAGNGKNYTGTIKLN